MVPVDSNTAILEPPAVLEPELRPVSVRPLAMQPAEDSEPSWIERGHIPGLDGLRALAVMLVLAVHSCQTPGFPQSSFVLTLARQGAIGVDIFFVISGFLITTLLVRELERHRTIQLKRFYVRRFLRIMPAYVSLLLVVFICQQAGYYHLQARDWIGATTYTMNFLHHPSWELGHSWSLSVEEHFYLIWPFVLYAGGTAAGWRVGLACVVGCWLIRCGIAFGMSRLLFPESSPYADSQLCAQLAETWTFTRLDTITMGSLLALACRAERGRQWLDRVASPLMMFVWLGLFCGSLFLMQSSKYTLCVAGTVNAACISLLMWGLIRSKGLPGRILANPILKVIGLGSYSLYLWQQLFVHPRHEGWIHQFPQNIILTCAVAFLSFWLIETPFNRLKEVTRGK